LFLVAEESADGVFIEFDAFDDLVRLHVDVVEDVAVYHCVDRPVLACAQVTYRTAGFVDEFGLTWFGGGLGEGGGFDGPGADGAVVGTADEGVVHDVKVADAFGMANELIEYVCLIGEAPLDNGPIFEAAEH
jgi:hypothetical protein